ncbi:membrane protein [Photobacterium kishitanii]|uniref:DedA family protein n=1 Tax=Photobacterium kishitanii TaxID=318456 RepID=A0A2T3KAH5_9GAMM|nr:DedA family protein [Photobacterium kishitanii]KJG07989.1 membrane protein [Photobacterium kishitanii]KJG55513.1 membrane protein [Photobacterium kishitanii]KJG58195.1 membrane protein [Photobacterium kishitanii]KJG63760.1 membrane protein [Photobacterium kishitanii]KJG66825.1 membrane protein [Photobacterium kishitanii]
MFETIQEILVALWRQDFDALLTPGSAIVIYIIVTLFILLESAFLPAAPLPCDSIVVLVGTLTAIGVLHPLIIFPLLILAASFGSWLAYLQGQWLNKLPLATSWLNKVPQKGLDTADTLLIRHGLIALFAARFIPCVRSVLPMMMGIRSQKIAQFHYFSWISACLWVGILSGLGWLLPILPDPFNRIVTIGLMIAPFVTLGIALITAIIWRLNKTILVINPLHKDM